jgi:hypothetical protein
LEKEPPGRNDRKQLYYLLRGGFAVMIFVWVLTAALYMRASAGKEIYLSGRVVLGIMTGLLLFILINGNAI